MTQHYPNESTIQRTKIAEFLRPCACNKTKLRKGSKQWQESVGL